MSLTAVTGGVAIVVALLAFTLPFIPEIGAGVRRARSSITAFWRSAARPIAAIALAAGLASAALAGAVSSGYADSLARQPGDIVYMSPIVVRADGRLALAPSTTIAEAARVYAGPADYWASSCRATLPGWRWPVDWQGVDAIGRPLWRASIDGAGVVTVDGLGPADADPLRALLAELAPIVACRE